MSLDNDSSSLFYLSSNSSLCWLLSNIFDWKVCLNSEISFENSLSFFKIFLLNFSSIFGSEDVFIFKGSFDSKSKIFLEWSC